MPDLYKIAAEVISASDGKRPADQAMRLILKKHRELAPWDAAEITQLVFTYYRWKNWLDDRSDMLMHLRSARALADQFRRDEKNVPAEKLLQLAVPDWIHGQMEVSDEWVRSLQRPPRLWLRTRKGQGPRVARALKNCRLQGEGRWNDTLEYQGDEDLFRTPAFHDGDFEVQDISSQAVGFICDPQPGETWWDACAGEGGKLLHLSSLMENRGLIWASDRAEWRLKNLKRRAARANVFNYRAAAWNGGTKLPTRTRFDGVLVDAPCSGVGTWQRNPHARWTTTADDVRELAAIQLDLLRNAAKSLKPGGKLVYSVCTLTRDETDGVADSFERECPTFVRESVEDVLKPGQGGARLWYWPQDHGGNGMFVAVWRAGSA